MACASRWMRWWPSASRALGLDQREGDVAVEARVVGAVDAFAGALAEEGLHLVAAGDEGGGMISRGDRGAVRCCGLSPRRENTARFVRRRIEKGLGIGVVGIETKDVFGEVSDAAPLPTFEGRVQLIKEPVNMPLDPLAWHRARMIACFDGR